MKKAKIIVPALLSIAACGGIIAGSTYALFTSEAKTNVAITSGKVNVVANVENLATYSGSGLTGDVETDVLSENATPGEFANGGSASLSENTIVISKMTPGDKITFDIKIKNKSNVTAKYRTILSCSEDDGLFDGLQVKVDGKSWSNFSAVSDYETIQGSEAEAEIKTVPVSIELPSDAGNAYQGKACSISYVVEAVQGNAATEWDANTLYLCSARDMYALSSASNSADPILDSYTTFKLLSDVALSSEWTPIGTSTNPFVKNFDGGNHAISNLKISDGSYIGLFGYVGANATVEKVSLVGANVSGVKRVGGLIGQINADATVSNCSIDAASTVVGSDSNTGGLIGEAIQGNISLKGLNNAASVTNTESGTSRAGGIIGQVTTKANVTIEDCVNSGTVKTNKGYAGGIVSAYQNGSLTIKNCQNKGTLDGTYSADFVAWMTSVQTLSIQKDGSIDGKEVGLISSDYMRYIAINKTEFFLNKTSESFTFSSALEGKEKLDGNKFDTILDFITYARTKNENIKNDYASVTSRWGVFRQTSLFGGNGWPEILTQYNTEKSTSLTSDYFEITWRVKTMYFIEN